MSDTSNAPSNPPAQDEDKRKRGAAIWWWGGGLTLAAAVAACLYAGCFQSARVRVQKQSVQNAFLFPVDGTDIQRHKASFDFIIFTKDYTWVKGSADQVERNGKTVSAQDIAAQVVSSQIRETLLHEKELIAVGLASREGERQTEEDRANRRSQTVAGWLKSIAAPETPIWRLNLGQYSQECASQEDVDTSFERPLIIAGVRTKDEGANLREALADAISGKENLPSRGCYSKFELTRSKN